MMMMIIILVSYVGEKPRWPVQSLNQQGRNDIADLLRTVSVKVSAKDGSIYNQRGMIMNDNDAKDDVDLIEDDYCYHYYYADDYDCGYDDCNYVDDYDCDYGGCDVYDYDDCDDCDDCNDGDPGMTFMAGHYYPSP